MDATQVFSGVAVVAHTFPVAIWNPAPFAKDEVAVTDAADMLGTAHAPPAATVPVRYFSSDAGEMT